MDQRRLDQRAVWICVLVIGLMAGYFAGGAASLSAQQAGSSGRFQLSTVAYGDRNHSVAVVLDTATGHVTPYVVGTNNSIDPGALRLTPFRVVEK